ncbi:MAG: imidazolonepropionase [Anaerovoracaceae bacterium]
MRTIIKNIGRLQTPTGNYSHSGDEQGENIIYENLALIIEDGIIKDFVQYKVLDFCDETLKNTEIIDAERGLVTPGLVDAHTHLVFGGYRENEIPMKLAGATYLDILKAGGGIIDTVEKTRAASKEELIIKSEKFLKEMMSYGVTSCEIKSGYGLNGKDEVKQLEVIEELKKLKLMTIVGTYMGAHAVPPEFKLSDTEIEMAYNKLAGSGKIITLEERKKIKEAMQKKKSDQYIDWLCKVMLPYVKEKGLAEYADVFCEDGAFTLEQSKKYLEAAKALGLKLRIHADEIVPMGGSELAGEFAAASAEHLIAIDDAGIEALSKAKKTTAMLLPGTSFYLDKSFAPARKMIEKDIPIALATDFNPGSCPSLNMQFIISLGYLKYKMTPEEILTAVTINPAVAIGKEKEIGTLEIGKKADLIIWDAPNMEMLCYRFGSNLVKTVIKDGKII